jgi:LacI family transcriptional regulator
VCRALMETGLDRKIQVICFDDMPQIRKLMSENRVSAIVYQNPFWQGWRSLEMLCDYLFTKRLPEKERNYAITEIRILESLLDMG